MKPYRANRQILLTLRGGLFLLGSAVFLLLLNPAARGDEAKAPEPAAEAPSAAPAEAPAAAPLPEPERISGELIKVDPEGKVIMVNVAPDRDRTSRAYKRYKLVLDEKSLILIDQQPSTISALQTGQLVEVGYFKKGKDQVVDTVVVTGKKEEQ